MNLTIELTEKDLKELVVKHLSNVLNTLLEPDDIMIEVKSKQNYKSEWEQAAFRARVSK